MRRDLENAYAPGCVDCQHNKSQTSKPQGPLHPLPVPDKRGSLVAMDFVGPLPEDKGFNCILTMTDWLGSDIHIIPTWMDITAKALASLFFKHWYWENGLPTDIVLDRDKLFIFKFWRALHCLTGVQLKMLTAYYLRQMAVVNAQIKQWTSACIITSNGTRQVGSQHCHWSNFRSWIL